MFTEHRLLRKVILSETDVQDIGSNLPNPSMASHQNVQPTPEGFNSIENAQEMLLFVDPENPRSIFDHPVFGQYLKPFDVTLFVDKPDASGKMKTSLRNKTTPISIPDGLGSVKILHILAGAKVKGSPTDDRYPLPRNWRNAGAEARDIVADLSRRAQSLGIYLDKDVVTSQNREDAMRALGIALGNVGYNPKLFNSDPNQVYTDGKLPERAPEAQDADDVVKSVRSAVANVVLITDLENGGHDFGSLTEAYDEGDMHSRTQSLLKALAQCPHNMMDCEAFTKILAKIYGNVKESIKDSPGASVEIEIYGPNAEGLAITDSLDNMNLDMLKAVHAGSGKENGPFMVRVKYRHQGAENKDVHVVVGKSLVFDNGGNGPKGDGGKKMQGDKMGGTALAAELARFGEEKPQINIDFVWPVSSNKADGNARQMDDIYTLSSGRTTEETHPDAEGRQVMADALGANLQLLVKQGEKASQITTVATLTGAAILAGGHRISVISDKVQLLRGLEDKSRKNGETVQGVYLDGIDEDAVKGKVADLRNLVPEGAIPRARGHVIGQAYVKVGAGVKDITYTGFDIASALDAHKGTPNDVSNHYMPGEGYLDTLHQHLTGKAAVGQPKVTSPTAQI